MARVVFCFCICRHVCLVPSCWGVGGGGFILYSKSTVTAAADSRQLPNTPKVTPPSQEGPEKTTFSLRITPAPRRGKRDGYVFFKKNKKKGTTDVSGAQQKKGSTRYFFTAL